MSRMTLKATRAALALTMTPGREPLEDAFIIHSGGRILEVGRYADIGRGFEGEVTDLGDIVLTPGVINSHAHLELSSLAGLVPARQGYEAYAAYILNRSPFGIDAKTIDWTIHEMKEVGTAFVAEFSGSKCSIISYLLERAGLDHHLVVQIIGALPPKETSFVPPPYTDLLPEAVKERKLCFTGHSLFVTNTRTFKMIRDWNKDHSLPLSIHIAECEGEVDLLRDGSGRLADVMREHGLIAPRFKPPGLSPAAYAARLGLLGPSTIAVHCVHVSDEDISLLAKKKTHVCLCPRSNQALGVGQPPFGKLMKAGLNVCLGTDSSATSPDMNVWNEVIHLRDNHRGHIGLEDLTALVTTNAAKALGVSRTHGTIEPGKRAVFSRVPYDLLM